MSLIALAMNPNISPEQFERLARERVDALERALDEYAKSLEQVSAEYRVRCFVETFPHVLSVLAMML